MFALSAVVVTRKAGLVGCSLVWSQACSHKRDAVVTFGE